MMRKHFLSARIVNQLKQPFMIPRILTFIINLLFVSGTSDGYLKKAVIESATSGIEYADIPIAPGTSVRSDLLFDLKRDHIYVLTDKALSKVRVQDCQQYTDCNTCLGAKDPYCGWCSLENKCR